jgi:hypothetical protein
MLLFIAGFDKYLVKLQMPTNQGRNMPRNGNKTLLQFQLPYARHYNPRFVFILPHFSLRFIFKRGLYCRAVGITWKLFFWVGRMCPPMVEIGLTDLPKLERLQPPQPPACDSPE